VNTQKSIGVIGSRNMCSVRETQVHVARSRHENGNRVTASGRCRLQLRLNQIRQNQSQIFFFDTTWTNRMVAVRSA
jgi:hypothetical protein